MIINGCPPVLDAIQNEEIFDDEDGRDVCFNHSALYDLSEWTLEDARADYRNRERETFLRAIERF